MNHVLGGGSFSSRLFEEVRDKRGLAYSVGSGLSNSRHADALVIGTATSPDRAAETLEVIRDTVARMAEEGPTEEELGAAKRYLLGSYAINNLDSSRAIANTLVGLQFEALGIDYIQRRPALIEAVTRRRRRNADRSNRARRRWRAGAGPHPGYRGFGRDRRPACFHCRLVDRRRSGCLCGRGDDRARDA